MAAVEVEMAAAMAAAAVPVAAVVAAEVAALPEVAVAPAGADIIHILLRHIPARQETLARTRIAFLQRTNVRPVILEPTPIASHRPINVRQVIPAPIRTAYRHSTSHKRYREEKTAEEAS